MSHQPLIPNANDDETPDDIMETLEALQAQPAALPDDIAESVSTVPPQTDSTTPDDAAEPVATSQEQPPVTMPDNTTESVTAPPQVSSPMDDDTPAPDQPDEPITYRYRVSIALSPDVESEINAARRSVNLPTASMGLFAVQSDFQCADLEPVKGHLQRWVSDNLPLRLMLERVEAVVEGEQRYIAGISLEPVERLRQAQAALAALLSSHITPVIQEPFNAHIPVSDHTPAKDFPHLIHNMQQQFNAREWSLNAVELLRAPENDLRWEVVEKFERQASL